MDDSVKRDKNIVHGTVTHPDNINGIHDPAVLPWERGVRKDHTEPMDRDAMRRNLLDVGLVMDQHGVPFVLTLGTLLGAVRDGNFIAHDNDSDIMCMWPDYTKMAGVIDELERHYGFFVPKGCPIHDTNFIRDGEKVEVWWFGEFAGKLVYYPRFWIEPQWMFDTIDYSFLGRSFKVPRDYDGLLRHFYSGDWRVPSGARWCGSDDKVSDNNLGK